jgi:uncharacterized protein YfaP (DUF2135 family)
MDAPHEPFKMARAHPAMHAPSAAFPRAPRALALALCTVALAACGADPLPTAPAPGAAPAAGAVRVRAVGDTLLAGPANQELAEPLRVEVRDAAGRAVPNYLVNFRVVAGGGSVYAGAALTDAGGRVVDRWTLGPAGADTQRVEVRAVDPATGERRVFATFRAVVRAGDPPVVLGVDTLRVVLSWTRGPNDLDVEMEGPTAGGGTFSVNSTIAGSCAASPFACKDRDDTRAPGTETITIVRRAAGTYRFRVYNYSNEAPIDASTTVELYAGARLVRTVRPPADVGRDWRLFEFRGDTVVLGGAPPDAPPPSDPAGDYDVEVRFVGSVPPAVQAAARSAVTRLRRVITRGVGTLRFQGEDLRACGDWLPSSFTGTVNSHLMFVGARSIDGPRGTLAQAGPCFKARAGLAVLSVVEVDLDDLGRPQREIDEVVLHEVLHAVGIGTFEGWESRLTGRGSGTPLFTGGASFEAWLAMGGSRFGLSGVPVEPDGGEGTTESHWRESTFGAELMTGFYDAGVSNPLSALTVAALRDLGYQVDPTAADAFALSATAGDRGATPARPRERWEVVRRPIPHP